MCLVSLCNGEGKFFFGIDLYRVYQLVFQIKRTLHQHWTLIQGVLCYVLGQDKHLLKCQRIFCQSHICAHTPPPPEYSQGSRLVFQTMVFQVIFGTLNVFFRGNSNSSLNAI